MKRLIRVFATPVVLALAGAAVTLGVATAWAAEIKPAVVFDMGGKFDKSFNQGVYDGVERFTKETGIKYREFEVTNETQREQALRRMAQRALRLTALSLEISHRARLGPHRVEHGFGEAAGEGVLLRGVVAR